MNFVREGHDDLAEQAPSLLAGRMVLVTGASGFLAQALIRRLRALPCRLRLLTRRPARIGPDPGGPGVSVEEIWAGDVTDPGTARAAAAGVDAILHLAGAAVPASTPRAIAADRRLNADSMGHLIDGAAATGRRPVVLMAGTDTQAGLPRRTPLTEAAPDRPLTPYDTHKCLAEARVRAAAAAGGVTGGSLRLPTLYGPGPRVGTPGRGMVNAMIRRGLAGQPLEIWGDGTARRDFLHVDDAADAFVAAVAAALRSPDGWRGDGVLVGTGRSLSVAEAVAAIADAIARTAGRRPPVRAVPEPRDLGPVDRRDGTIDPARFVAATGWRAAIRFEDGVAATVAAFAAPTSSPAPPPTAPPTAPPTVPPTIAASR